MSDIESSRRSSRSKEEMGSSLKRRQAGDSRFSPERSKPSSDDTTTTTTTSRKMASPAQKRKTDVSSPPRRSTSSNFWRASYIVSCFIILVETFSLVYLGFMLKTLGQISDNLQGKNTSVESNRMMNAAVAVAAMADSAQAAFIALPRAESSADKDDDDGVDDDDDDDDDAVEEDDDDGDNVKDKHKKKHAKEKHHQPKIEPIAKKDDNNQENKDDGAKEAKDSQPKTNPEGSKKSKVVEAALKETSGFSEVYTPRLIPESDEKLDLAEGHKFKGIHIVRSRYQQGQPNAIALGRARLQLFQNFCLPSMVAQSTNNFVWLIYTDPQLDKGLRQRMVDLLAPYPNFFFIASMENVLWKAGQAEFLANATVYTGNQTLLEQAMAIRNNVPILETRLDADDALNRRYLEYLQKDAAEKFYKKKFRWMYWCIRDELQWYWIGRKGQNEEQRNQGLTTKLRNRDFCPTPGLTLGYNKGANVTEIYRRKHSTLIERLNLKNQTKDKDLCGPGHYGPDCYQVVARYKFPAMRTRTPTSSSMIMSEFNETVLVDRAAANDSKFDVLENDFGISRTNCEETVTYLNDNILCLARAALQDLCSGLFCPEGAKIRLNGLIQTLQDDGYNSNKCISSR